MAKRNKATQAVCLDSKVPNSSDYALVRKLNRVEQNYEEENYYGIRSIIDGIKQDIRKQKYSDKDLREFIIYNKNTKEAGLVTTVLAELNLEKDIYKPLKRSEVNIKELQKTETKRKSPFEIQAELFNFLGRERYAFLGFNKDYLQNIKESQAAFSKNILIINSSGKSAYKSRNTTLEGIAKDESFEKSENVVLKDHAGAREESFENVKVQFSKVMDAFFRRNSS